MRSRRFLAHLDLRKSVYGYIGLEDYTLFPLIRPGSLVEIDAHQRKISTEKWKTEFDVPSTSWSFETAMCAVGVRWTGVS